MTKETERWRGGNKANRCSHDCDKTAERAKKDTMKKTDLIAKTTVMTVWRERKIGIAEER